MTPNTIQIRDADKNDVPFLREMLFEAAYWRPNVAPPSIDEGLAHPDLAKLLAGWGRPGDTGVVGERRNSREPLGAAWYRYWTDENHSYGFVAPDVPELAIGVRVEHRGRGLGQALVEALLVRAYEAGVKTVSLSVEDDNPAKRLYERLGFQPVGTVGNARTMTRDLACD